MKITVKKLQGGECILDILPTTTIIEIKERVFDKLGIPVQEQKLLLLGRTLADDQTVAGYPTIKEGTKINVVIKKPERQITNAEQLPKKPEVPAKTSEISAKKLDRPLKQPRGSIKKPQETVPDTDELYEVSKEVFKNQGMNDSEATNTAKKLLKVIEDKFNLMSWDDIDKLCLDCLMDEKGMRRTAVDKDAECEDAL